LLDFCALSALYGTRARIAALVPSIVALVVAVSNVTGRNSGFLLSQSGDSRIG
jgi:hypothetical protein